MHVNTDILRNHFVDEMADVQMHYILKDESLVYTNQIMYDI